MILYCKGALSKEAAQSMEYMHESQNTWRDTMRFNNSTVEVQSELMPSNNLAPGCWSNMELWSQRPAVHSVLDSLGTFRKAQ